MVRIWEQKNSSIKCFLNKEKKEIKFIGPLGECTQVFQGEDIIFNDKSVFIKSKTSYGYFQGRIKSLLEGVKHGYFIELNISGRGYRFIDLVEKLLIKLGYTHYYEYKKPEGLFLISSRSNLLIFGLDLAEVNAAGALIRNLMVPEVYKGKGIRYVHEEVQLKVGKKN